jgi:hypothetical protein
MWTWETVITLAVALLGAVLGVLSTCWQFNNSRVKLRVHFFFAVKFSDGFIRQMPMPIQNFREFILSHPGEPLYLSVEIINLSSFAVTINEIGFCDKNISDHRRFVAVAPEVIDEGAWPRRLVSRDAVVIYTLIGTKLETLVKYKKLYAKTACGEVKYLDVRRAWAILLNSDNYN